MFETLRNALKDRDIRLKILYTVLLIIVYRIGCYIPVPGLDPATVQSTIASSEFLGILSTITGG